MKIEVWCNDDTTDEQKPWTVSRCHDDGEEARCYAAFAERFDAIAFAKEKAESLSIGAIARHRDGNFEKL